MSSFVTTLYARYCKERAQLQLGFEPLETKLERALNDSKKNTWGSRSRSKTGKEGEGKREGKGEGKEGEGKREGKGEGESVRVTSIRDKITALHVEIAAFDTTHEILLQYMESDKQHAQETLEFNAWVSGAGLVKKPKFIQDRDDREYDEFINSCTVLKRFKSCRGIIELIQDSSDTVVCVSGWTSCSGPPKDMTKDDTV